MKKIWNTLKRTVIMHIVAITLLTDISASNVIAGERNECAVCGEEIYETINED